MLQLCVLLYATDIHVLFIHFFNIYALRKEEIGTILELSCTK